jgi:muramoyltetrapeptide carboxypeptidase
MTNLNHKVGFIAPSSPVPPYEFQLGLERFKPYGLTYEIHPQCRKKNLFFAGTDEERAQALWDYAHDSEISVLWCARGGYGAYRLLPILDRWTRERGKPPRKLLVGYSDSTGLLEYVRTQWGWASLHGPTPGLKNFTELKKSELEHVISWIQGRRPTGTTFGSGLKFLGRKPMQDVEGVLVGGNLATWQALQGTPYQSRESGRILFLEDVGETLSRLDRMFHHLMQSGGLDGVSGLLLGDFTDCRDIVRDAWTKPSGSKKPKLGPSRAEVSMSRYFRELFQSISECYKIPVVTGVPAGHGKRKESLPLGARYRLEPTGNLELLSWDWLRP